MHVDVAEVNGRVPSVFVSLMAEFLIPFSICERRPNALITQEQRYQ